MKNRLRRQWFVFAAVPVAALFAAIFWSSYPHGFQAPDVSPPAGSTNVRFHREDGWQFLRYFYRIDNDPSVSKEFARELMKGSRGQDVVITETPFEKFPITGDFPSWFVPNTIDEGTLITGDDWIYAVVDKETGRMFYYDGH